MKRIRTATFFDEDNRLSEISSQRDPLEKLNKRIDWSIFQPILKQVFDKETKGKGGRPRYDLVMMFKIMILQRYYNISDEQTEYQILDRISFMRFLGLRIWDKVPDCNTIWLFRENLTKSGKMEEIFKIFEEQLRKEKLIANKGSIIDASFVESPRQRNSRQENKEIKENKIPERFQENENVMRHKDLDARWTKKLEIPHFGYKNHVKVDSKSKLINRYEVTDASVHDSNVLVSLLDETNVKQKLWADSAYGGEPIAKQLIEKQIINQIHEKGKKNAPLTEEQFENNRIKSKTRARVEHVFGFIEKNMHGSYIKTIGIARARTVIGLMNLTYNMFRYMQLSIA